MDSEDLSRRLLLRALAAAVGAAAVPAGWMEMALSAGQESAKDLDSKLSFFSASEAADVEAVAAQIVPTDDTPGAREAGVIHFIDRALAAHFPLLASEYQSQLSQFQTTFGRLNPGTGTFSSLASDRQIEYLKTVDRTPFFETTRLLTLLGLFTMPKYGGNRGETGWKLIGFEVKHVFQPPFGYYDRGYPGFAIDPEHTK